MFVMRAMLVLALAVPVSVGGGCASRPPLKPSGFIGDYSRLERVDDHTMRYVSARVREYSGVIIEPVEARFPAKVLKEEERAEALRYAHAVCERGFVGAGFAVVSEPGPGVARVRMALTDVAASTWWQKVHPGMRASGAGTGGAAMESEVVDSVSGEQIAAVIQSASGNQFDLTAFSTLADVKSAIDKWGEGTSRRLREVREGGARVGGGS
jgi:hypothetical protein